MAKKKETKLVSGIGGFNTAFQDNVAKARKKTEARDKKLAAEAKDAAAAEQKKVDAKRKARDAAKKKK